VVSVRLTLLAVQLLALASLVYGVSRIYVPAAFIVGGSLVAYMVERVT
jgi:hypothetical protein